MSEHSPPTRSLMRFSCEWQWNCEIGSVVADAILKFDGERYDLDSLVIMPNHAHAIVQFRIGFDLDTIGQSWIRYTARFINKQIGRTGVLWQGFSGTFQGRLASSRWFISRL